MHTCKKISITAAHTIPPMQDQTCFALYLVHSQTKRVAHKKQALCVYQ